MNSRVTGAYVCSGVQRRLEAAVGVWGKPSTAPERLALTSRQLYPLPLLGSSIWHGPRCVTCKARTSVVIRAISSGRALAYIRRSGDAARKPLTSWAAAYGPIVAQSGGCAIGLPPSPSPSLCTASIPAGPGASWCVEHRPSEDVRLPNRNPNSARAILGPSLPLFGLHCLADRRVVELRLTASGPQIN